MTPEDAIYWYTAGLEMVFGIIVGPFALVMLTRWARSFMH